MDVPYRSYDQLKAAAVQTLAESPYRDRFPVDIEMIVERDFRIDVVPIRGLQKAFRIDAFISRDATSISVDEFVLENRLNRYRFTLAHELGHRVLHRDILRAMSFRSIDQWKAQMADFPESEYRILEYQANTFANCLLIPPGELDQRFEQAIARIRAGGLDPADHPDACLDAICTELGRQFEVSKNATQIRLESKYEDFQSRLC